MLRFVLTLVVAAGLSSYVFAADKCNGTCDKSKVAAKGEKKTPEERFAAMDTNKDGKLSLEEFQAGVKKHVKDEAKLPEALKRAEKRFKAIDTNNDGFISLEEFKAAPPEQHGNHKKSDK